MYQQQLSEAVAVSRPSGSCGPKVRHSWRLSGGFEGGACSEMPLSFGGGAGAERGARAHPDSSNER